LNSGERISEEMLAGQIKVGGYSASHTLPMVVDKPAEQSDRELILRQLLFIRQDISDLTQLAVGRKGPSDEVDPYLPSHQSFTGEGQGGPVISEDVTQIEPHPLIDPEAVGEVTMEEMERELIQQTLAKFNHNRRRTAQALGIAERTLYRKIQTYELDKK
ncbi:MAG: helix-turn-helix domain-containing protein, partial [Candidatus Neomarinimicrobiota bacterium]